MTEVDGIPVTSLAWTVVDYAAIANQRQVRLVLEALERRRVYIGRELDELLERNPEPQAASRPLRTAIAEIERTGAVAAVGARGNVPRADPRVRPPRATRPMCSSKASSSMPCGDTSA